ncbi:VOC family protein [Nocardia sp. NBC_01377]|uniref:VOC family protein n=1 Tax=Nocardia sp. NBC_01377 TaxID=2903595 RepID=UPI003245B248
MWSAVCRRCVGVRPWWYRERGSNRYAARVSDEEDWVVLADAWGRRIAFQTSPDYQPPKFPDTTGSQQIHFDVRVDDIEVAQPRALALGASLVQAETDGAFRVYRDPVGHTFCLVWLPES